MKVAKCWQILQDEIRRQEIGSDIWEVNTVLGIDKPIYFWIEGTAVLLKMDWNGESINMFHLRCFFLMFTWSQTGCFLMGPKVFVCGFWSWLGFVPHLRPHEPGGCLQFTAFLKQVKRGGHMPHLARSYRTHGCSCQESRISQQFRDSGIKFLTVTRIQQYTASIQWTSSRCLTAGSRSAHCTLIYSKGSLLS